ncbi:MAG: ImmA/IrrE family metallo-endopeptidase [Ruminococcaceae bacterium]|nr:ImmA/IrrE family metallo-endopeptidase [Oscillospiraceae bacterium]
MTEAAIRDTAVSLLLRQPLQGAFALHFFDYRHFLTDGKVLFDTIASYESRTGTRLPIRVDGLSIQNGPHTLLFYEDRGRSRSRIAFTIAHELGHIYLSHREGSRHEENEANRFAAELLLPTCVVRYLDCRLGHPLSPLQLTAYSAASLTVCRRRRAMLDRLGPSAITENETKLVKRLFLPEN